MCDETYNSEMKNNPKFKTIFDVDGPGPMSKQEFLNQFPENKIKDGKLIPIREELEKRFQETQQIDVSKLNSNEPICPETHVKEDQVEPANIVNLRIRTETGKKTILLKLLVTDPIAKVYQYVRPYIEGAKGTHFELRTNFPNKSYRELDEKTLKEHGLAPSCALIVRAI